MLSEVPPHDWYKFGARQDVAAYALLVLIGDRHRECGCFQFICVNWRQTQGEWLFPVCLC